MTYHAHEAAHMKYRAERTDKFGALHGSSTGRAHSEWGDQDHRTKHTTRKGVTMRDKSRHTYIIDHRYFLVSVHENRDRTGGACSLLIVLGLLV